MLKKLVIFVLLFSATILAQNKITKLQKAIDEVVDDPFFTRTTIAIDVYDLTESEHLYQLNNQLLLYPASNMKLLTTAAALTYLGEDYIFQTSFYHTGVISGDTLYGDFYIAGGFDPDFNTADLDSMIKSVKSLGIKVITGNLYGDVSQKDSLYWGKGWMWDDDPDPTQPRLSSLNINDNTIEVFVEGTKVGLPGKVILNPETNFVGVVNNSISVSSSKKTNLKITRDWVGGTNKIIIDGEVSVGAIKDSSLHEEKLNLLQPGFYFLTLFREHLQNEGIAIIGKNKLAHLPENSVYLSAFNQAIDSIIFRQNKESENLYAEMLVYALALNDSGVPANSKNGVEAVKRFIDSLNLDPDDYYIADGSGISRYNLLSAELLVNLLKYVYLKPFFKIYFNSLPIAGVDGTLEKRMTSSSAKGNVFAKTGTLKGVSALSGYVKTKGKNFLAFSILVQHYTGKSTAARDFIDRICEILADY